MRAILQNLGPILGSDDRGQTWSGDLITVAGATIVPGTDAGINPAKPHDVVRYAIEQQVLLGMSTDEALRSATSTGATVCGLGDHKGRIDEGYDADVLAIDGDPLTDPGALHNIRAVFLRGERLH